MRYLWNLPAQADLAGDIARRKIERVLIEYDGPQLVILVDNSSYYLGLAADYNETSERWIHAKVSRLEIEALVRGSIAMRDVFTSKPALAVIDYDEDGNPKRTWGISPADIPAGILPLKGAPLPRAVRAELEAEFVSSASQNTGNVFRLVGRPVYENKISFAALGEVTLHLQRLWNALATKLPKHRGGDETEDGIFSPETLLIAGVVHRSFGIEIAAIDQEVFDDIAAEYTEITRVTLEENAAESLRAQPANVLHPYRDYLKTLARLEIEIMAEFYAGPVFLGLECARYISEELGARRSGASSAERATEATVTIRGYFERFGLNDRRFELYDLANGELKSGRISKELIASMRRSGTPAAVSTGQIYDATLLVKYRTGKQAYTLLQFRHMSLIPADT
jgi:hypothetical protein